MKIDLIKLDHLCLKPPVFEQGDDCFWTHPYISEQMLAAHLNPDIDAASRKRETIDGTVRFWLENGWIAAGDHLLDLGCGPGLYRLMI